MQACGVGTGVSGTGVSVFDIGAGHPAHGGKWRAGASMHGGETLSLPGVALCLICSLEGMDRGCHSHRWSGPCGFDEDPGEGALRGIESSVVSRGHDGAVARCCHAPATMGQAAVCERALEPVGKFSQG